MTRSNTPAPDKPVAEGIARIIRHAMLAEPHRVENFKERADLRCEIADKAVAAILSAYPLRDEAAIRADEREKCAAICDAIGDDIMKEATVAHENESYDLYEELESQAFQYSHAAAAIREGAK
jgi:hypothetical protein